jgi:hypothetical protein
MKPMTTGFLTFSHSLLAAAGWVVAILGLPMAWILRDGLGPDSAGSSGWDAVGRWLATFHIGPVLLVLLGLWALTRILAARSATARPGG